MGKCGTQKARNLWLKRVNNSAPQQAKSELFPFIFRAWRPIYDPMAFRVMGSGRPVHAFEHISTLKSLHPEAHVVIGCDSQNYSQRTFT